MRLPDGFTVRARDDVRLLPTADGGLSLVGGSPLRSMRLASTAADRVAGRKVQVDDATSHAIARRLLDGNLADPAGLTPADPGELTVIVPAHDRPDLLDRCLAALSGLGGLNVIVVDDAFGYPEAVAELGRRLDDLAYGAGLWLGVARSRSVQCLTPRLVRRPRR
jgi:hypothetical protein